ncbi:MAG: ABC transporter ATP-binding protein, partial [Lachnospiraceae bacterium]|nr:ABC transporter ATP-binding protein [Lachnospiraceae bacterium]
THDQEEAMSISDLIIVMKDGSIHQIGAPQEVYDNPVDGFVAKFLGTPPINMFRGRVEAGKLYIGDEAVLSVAGAKEGPVSVGIRPEGFVLDEKGPLTCDLTEIEVMGRDVTVVSTHMESENVEIRSIISAENKVDFSSNKVRFSLKPKKVLLFDTETEERIFFQTN